MDEMPSSEFRRRYATLTQPTIVTVIGRPIGQWIPAGHALTVRVDGDTVTIDPPPMRDQPVRVEARIDGHAFRSRPFTPAPKGK